MMITGFKLRSTCLVELLATSSYCCFIQAARKKKGQDLQEISSDSFVVLPLRR